jgi:glycosyltransferase involved in cell wall biosynthesis
MKIIFDLRSVGLGNNGGSSTLVKSGNTLMDMGHDVYFVDSGKNQHKWTPLKAEHIIVSNRGNNKIPDADVIIATGYKSVGPTMRSPGRCGHKAHWIRAWEHWQMGEYAIVNKVLKAPTIKLVNSVCLEKKLKNHGFDSEIIYPGYDFEDLFPKNVRQKNKKIILGGLYREGIHGQRKRTPWLYEVARYMKSRHKDVEFWLFGSENKPQGMLHDKYLRSPTIKQKNNFYNNVDIWMAPTMSEGLHLPPAEAMMTECPVVATKAELSGVQDYIINDETGLLANDDLRSFIRDVEHLYDHKICRKRLGKAGKKRIDEIGDRKKNMQIMVDFFMGIINENI